METVVNYNSEEKTAIVYTRDKSVMRKLDRFVEDYPDIYKLLKQTDIDKTYSMPKSYITYRRPRTMNISDEQRERLRQLGKMRRDCGKVKVQNEQRDIV